MALKDDEKGLRTGMKKKKKNRAGFLAFMTVLALLLLCAMAFLIIRNMPSKKRMNLTEYYPAAEGSEAVLILGSEILEERGRIVQGKGYLPMNVVTDRINAGFYWDQDPSELLYTAGGQTSSVPVLSEPGGEAWLDGDTLYISTDHTARFTDMDVCVLTEPNRIAVQTGFENIQAVTAQKNTAVRYQGGIKSDILTDVKRGDVLLFLEDLDDWLKVASWDGCIGYVPSGDVSSPEETTLERSFQPVNEEYRLLDEPVNLVWNMVTNTDANAGMASLTGAMEGVNVLSPTWFALSDNEGNISDLSSASYVETAHKMGCLVWGLVDNFTYDISTLEVLSHAQSRRRLIDNLMQAAESCRMDGINVDFERLTEDNAPHVVQFLKELMIEAHSKNLTVSVDTPVPEVYTEHYNRKEQAKAADYVILMGYDEHYEGSESAGSVASLPWVEQGVVDLLDEVPAERTVLAVPFYTRLWWTLAGTLHSEAISMQQQSKYISEYQPQIYWDTELSQNVASWENNDIPYKVWMEDAQSLAEKVRLVPEYHLAGIAGWRLGFESSDVWQIIQGALSISTGG